MQKKQPYFICWAIFIYSFIYLFIYLFICLFIYLLQLYLLAWANASLLWKSQAPFCAAVMFLGMYLVLKDLRKIY